MLYIITFIILHLYDCSQMLKYYQICDIINLTKDSNLKEEVIIIEAAVINYTITQKINIIALADADVYVV